MATTRTDIETVLVRRCGALLAAAGLAVTHVGANDDLNDPIGTAIRKLGGSVSSISAVADADITTISSDFTIDALLDIAELQTLNNVQGNYALVDIGEGPHRESLSQVMTALETRIARLATKITRLYGIDGATLSSGVLTFDFADHVSDNFVTATGEVDIYGRPIR